MKKLMFFPKSQNVQKIKKVVHFEKKQKRLKTKF